MITSEGFSASYEEARKKFLAAAKEAGGAVESFRHPERAPDRGELFTDAAWFGPKDAERALVTISGTHGVEGYCGSGAQIDWLKRGEAARLPAGVAALLIHAINPHGFAWDRRVTQENVDLNRNWIDFGAKLPENSAYDELADFICPRTWDQESQQRAMAGLLGYAQAHGMPALQQAVSGGQYRHPKGIFYGGAGPAWSRRTQTDIFGAYLSDARRVAIIDYHSGLGPWGFGEQIAPARNPESFKRARKWFGGAVTSPSGGTSASADISGDGLGAAPSLLPRAEVTGLALEFGTVPMFNVLAALRADAWLHAYGDFDTDEARQAADARGVLRRPRRLEGNGRRAVAARLPSGALRIGRKLTGRR